MTAGFASMIPDIRQRLDASPFQPFSIVMSSGKTYLVASRDHASINPKQTQVVVFFDDESSIVLSSLHIASVRKPGRCCCLLA